MGLVVALAETILIYYFSCRVTLTTLSTYFLRGHNMLCLPKPLTTSYGINSFSYLAATSWNSLPDHYRTISDFTSFRRLISTGNNNLLKRAGTANLSTSR